MNGKTVGVEATETYARENLPIYHSPALVKSEMCGLVAEKSAAPWVHRVITCVHL